jgi:hypothetical protein
MTRRSLFATLVLALLGVIGCGGGPPGKGTDMYDSGDGQQRGDGGG